MMKKRYTCYNCGHRTQRNTTQTLINTGERIRCPECDEGMVLVSVEELLVPRRVSIEG